MSKRTFEELLRIIVEIRRRAALSKDDDTYRDADRAHALLQKLVHEMWIEDQEFLLPKVNLIAFLFLHPLLLTKPLAPRELMLFFE